MSNLLKYCQHSQFKAVVLYHGPERDCSFMWCKSCGSYSLTNGAIWHPPYSVIRKYARCKACGEPEPTYLYKENCKCSPDELCLEHKIPNCDKCNYRKS